MKAYFSQLNAIPHSLDRNSLNKAAPEYVDPSNANAF